ncbi:uncharacterized protein LOC125664192 isoform X2 [Ostrea edulis]|uniref:uncharacterized protein LOC125664192 isoform X2 n=1 Tax=Ostrea edulis TaxID=37623 RepID=UPI0024AF6E36|nr:uncharacterized protein LOC125664192 isoform X2 [Ostrea edulis]
MIKCIKRGFCLSIMSGRISSQMGETHASTTKEETSNATVSNEEQTESSNFQACLEDSSFSTADDFEHVEAMFSTLMENPQHDSQETIPLSNELRRAITNMEDIDDVDNLIGNVINSIQVDSSYDEDLYCIEQAVSKDNPEDGHIIKDRSLAVEGSHAKGFGSKTDEQIRKKDRIKKDNHNIIERRRRYNINDRIKELAILLPPTTHPAMKLNKGSILKASVEYVKELKRDQKKLASFEANQKAIEAKYQKMLRRIFQLELKMKLYGLTQEKSIQTKRKKRPRRRICEIDAMVDDLMKNSLSQKADKRFGNRQINRQSTFDSKSNCSPNVAKTGLRNFINKRISGITKSKDHMKTSQSTTKLETESTEHYSSSRCEEYAGKRGQEGNSEISAFMQTSHFPDQVECKELHLTIPEQTYIPQIEDMVGSTQLPPNAELSLDQCNILLDLLGTDQLTILQTEAESDSSPTSVPSPSPSEDRSSSTLSPLSVTTNMLEELLRKSDGSPSSFESHSSENSTE